MPKILLQPVAEPTSQSKNAAQQEAGAMTAATVKSGQKWKARLSRPSKKPLAQKARIHLRYLAGQSQRQIAKSEKINKDTVNKVVRELNQDAYVAALRERVLGLGDLAPDSLTAALPDDGQLAFKVLQGLGAIPQQHKVSLTVQANTAEEVQQLKEANYVGSLLIQAHQTFGLELPRAVDLRKLYQQSEWPEGLNEIQARSDGVESNKRHT